MASELTELAREVGGDELAERVKRLQEEVEEVEQEIVAELEEDQELGQLLREESNLSESAVEDMSLQAKREVAEEFDLREETVNVRIPVAGRTNEEPDESEEVAINRSSQDTYTKEVEVPAPGGDDDPETMTVEYANQGPSLEAISQFEAKLHEMRAEESRRREERAEEHRENQDMGAIPNHEYMNDEEVDIEDMEDSDIPVAGRDDREYDDE